MNTFVKDNWWKVSILVIIIITIGGWFYWYGLRPAQIKHDCSWVKKHAGVWAEITQEQYNKCCENQKTNASYFNNLNTSSNFEKLVITPSCFCEKPHAYRPAIDWYEPATSAHYSFCIHEKGL